MPQAATSVSLVLVLLLSGAIWAHREQQASVSEEVREGEPIASADTSLGSYAEDNVLVTANQRPGISVIIPKVILSTAAYVVVRESKDGTPGAVLGVSDLLTSGDHDRVRVMLDRGTRDGETLYAILYAEAGDSSFDLDTDLPLVSALGGAIQAPFTIDIHAKPALVALP